MEVNLCAGIAQRSQGNPLGQWDGGSRESWEEGKRIEYRDRVVNENNNIWQEYKSIRSHLSLI